MNIKFGIEYHLVCDIQKGRVGGGEGVGTFKRGEKEKKTFRESFKGRGVGTFKGLWDRGEGMLVGHIVGVCTSHLSVSIWNVCG